MAAATLICPKPHSSSFASILAGPLCPSEGHIASVSLNSSSTRSLVGRRIRAVSLNEIPPNALRRKRDPLWRGGFSLGVDLGSSRTGLALSKGFSIRPLTVLELRGQKLELRLLEIAEQKEADEFIIGLPKSSDGKETPQSNIVRSVAGRLAVRAAQRGLSKSARQGELDAYAAMMVLERYFSMSGHGTEIVWPKQLELQEMVRRGPPMDVDFFPEKLKA
ncbi:uncharacterized protein LOC131165739 isoform X2 [Malania oleifera]|uniref:uncharacterized protein LOC131165739 isoform X2 n=1 Tax=Malania oleifera TaxID=397392 RepID=UPI0025AE183F|nr:uncharacterized protein LOC131165739 isoform X2 [Malania oleifera]